MRRILLIILVIMLVCSGIVPSFADSKPTSSKVIAYYFHGNFRCPTCYKLETYSKEAIETSFKDELTSGKLVFKVVNTHEKVNEHFVNDYQLYTKSLVISLIENGKEVKSKNLTKIWDYVGNKSKFFEYVAGEISIFLEGL